MERETTSDVTVIGHGSLMSGRGLSFSGKLQVKQACIVALQFCRRGFAKLSRYGDRFATDIETQEFPLEGRQVSHLVPPNGEVEALALTVSLDDFSRLVKREGYSPEAMRQLAQLAHAEKKPLADFLWRIQSDAGQDPVRYRRQLFSLTGFTSPHYIPHPVGLAEMGYALIFLAPGFEGTGSDEVVSVRQQTKIPAVMSTSKTWQQKPNDDQLSYFLSCLLAGVHGVNIQDLLASVTDDPTLTMLLQNRLRQEVQEEVARFLAVTSLSPETYGKEFGTRERCLTRSGLRAFLLAGVTEQAN